MESLKHRRIRGTKWQKNARYSRIFVRSFLKCFPASENSILLEFSLYNLPVNMIICDQQDERIYNLLKTAGSTFNWTLRIMPRIFNEMLTSSIFFIQRSETVGFEFPVFNETQWREWVEKRSYLHEIYMAVQSQILVSKHSKLTFRARNRFLPIKDFIRATNFLIETYFDECFWTQSSTIFRSSALLKYLDANFQKGFEIRSLRPTEYRRTKTNSRNQSIPPDLLYSWKTFGLAVHGEVLG